MAWSMLIEPQVESRPLKLSTPELALEWRHCIHAARVCEENKMPIQARYYKEKATLIYDDLRSHGATEANDAN